MNSATKPWCLHHFWQRVESIAPATQNHTQTLKSGPRPSGFNTLKLPNLLCTTEGVHFLTISMSARSEAQIRSTHWGRNQLSEAIWGVWQLASKRASYQIFACSFWRFQVPNVTSLAHLDFISTGLFFSDLLSSSFLASDSSAPLLLCLSILIYNSTLPSRIDSVSRCCPLMPFVYLGQIYKPKVSKSWDWQYRYM